MYRAEDKYYLTKHEFILLTHKVSTVLSPDKFDGGRGYTISSLYFDDLKDTHLNNTICGVAYREKYRIRIYNNSLDTIKLEVKQKAYNRVRKLACNISHEELMALCKGEPIPSENSLEDPRTLFNLQIKNAGLRPKVIVTYERRAFLFDTGNVRITFDKDIRGSSYAENFGSPTLKYEYPFETADILEVKYDEIFPEFIAQLLENEHMLQTSNSKYRICRELYQTSN